MAGAVFLCLAGIFAACWFFLPENINPKTLIAKIDLSLKKEEEVIPTPSPTPTPTPTPTPEPEGFYKPRWLKEHEKVRGIYVTGPVAGSDRFEELLTLVDETELNAMVIDVKNDEGAVTFLAEAGPSFELETGVNYIRDIEGLMAELKAHDVYAIARIVCFKDPELAKKRPELALLNEKGKPVTDGGGLAWVDPTNEEVWDYLASLGEYCADLGFDEVQFDYVRFPVGDEAEKAVYSREVTEENKHTYITDFLAYTSERIHEKEIPVTADVFGTIIKNPIDVLSVGQDYRDLAGVADALCPMVYPSHYSNGVFGIDVPDKEPYETVFKALSDSAEELSALPKEETGIVRPWLQAFTATWVKGHIEYGEDEIRKQIDAVYDAGYDEWILWNAKNNYTSDGLLSE